MAESGSMGQTKEREKMKSEKQIEYKGWTIAIKVVTDGFKLTASNDGIDLIEDKANPGRLKQRVMQMRAKIDEASRVYEQCVQELQDFKE